MSLVRDFHIRFGSPAPDTPPLRPDPDEVRRRARFIREEYEEVMEQLEILANAQDPRNVIITYRRLLKELADLAYVTEGTAVSLGLPFDTAVAAVHASNMTKSGVDGTGKVMKGPYYVEPDMSMLVPGYLDTNSQED